MFKNLSEPYVIAEISGNHNGSIERAKKIIESAKDNGADCVKLQTYSPDTMTIKSNNEDFRVTSGLWNGYTLWDLYDWAQTPFEWQSELFTHAKNIGITCISTPFDETAVDLLENIGCPFYKIASFELTDLPLIRYVAETKKPLILSTGMANEEEIYDALNIVNKYGSNDYIILHCVSGYPTPVEQINLDTINLLKRRFKCDVGLSDHTLGNTSAILSIAYGVKIIEKHFTLSRDDGGPDANFSMEPDELKLMVDSVNQVWESIGKPNYKLKKSEKQNLKFRRSIYVINNIKKGDIFNNNNIKIIRPGYGIPPKYYNNIIGKKSLTNIKIHRPLKWKYIKKIKS